MDKRRVSVRHGAFETDIAEAGQGSPLLYLHGENGLEWSPFLDQLAEKHRVIAPVTPGFGDTTGSDEVNDLNDLLYYYLDLLDQENLRGVPMVGQGLGGMIAAELAAVQPERFTRLVLIAPFGLWLQQHPTMDYFAASAGELAKALFANAESPEAVAATTVPQGDEFIPYMLDRTKSQRTAAKYLWPIPHKGLDKRIHRITMPTLIVWGEKDGVSPVEYAREFHRLIPSSKVEIIADAAHLPQIEQPQALARTVEAFLG